MSSQTFEGVSRKGDFQEALAAAIAAAKAGLTTSWIKWKLVNLSGQDGGFVLETILRVEIEANSAAGTAKETGVVFQMADASTKDFFLLLIDPAKIAHARKIISGEETLQIHVKGTVVKQPAPYNQGWSFHLDPESIEFFENAIEVCDSTAQLVEKDLSDVCGAFLPDCHWCPWTSRIIAEVH